MLYDAIPLAEELWRKREKCTGARRPAWGKEEKSAKLTKYKSQHVHGWKLYMRMTDARFSFPIHCVVDTGCG
jgi:hypothetical protein